MADLSVTSSPNVLITTGLGSCVGVSLYDPVKKIGGLAHIMLPGSGRDNTAKPFKYSEPALEHLLYRIESEGAVKRRLVAKIAGGAQMFNLQGELDILQIGKRNVEAVRSFLQNENIPIKGEDVGGNFARTMEFYTSDGLVLVKSFKRGDREL